MEREQLYVGVVNIYTPNGFISFKTNPDTLDNVYRITNDKMFSLCDEHPSNEVISINVRRTYMR